MSGPLELSPAFFRLWLDRLNIEKIIVAILDYCPKINCSRAASETRFVFEFTGR